MNTRVQNTWCPQCDMLQPMTREYCLLCKHELALIDRRYRLLRALEKGGSGTIYLAHDTRKQRQVALKVVQPKVLAKNPNASIRFEREIRTTRLLSDCSHHAVQWYGAGEDPNIGIYMAIEYLEGQTLKKRQEERATEVRHLAFHIFFQLCDILADAHILGIVHRDLKPDNIFLIEQSGDPYFVKLIDFGLVKTLQEKQHPGLTKGMIGTPLYMAPEQAVMARVDERADIYALGLIVYEMLLGSPAFYDNDIRQLLLAHANQKPEPMAQRRPDLTFPQGLQEVLFKAIAKKPADRYDSILEFAQHMAEYDPCDSERWAHLTTPALSNKSDERFATIQESSNHTKISDVSATHNIPHRQKCAQTRHIAAACNNDTRPITTPRNNEMRTIATPRNAATTVMTYEETISHLVEATTLVPSFSQTDTRRITFWLGLLLGLLCTMIVLVLLAVP